MKFSRVMYGMLALFAMVCLSKAAWADIYCEREVLTKYKMGTEMVTKTTHQRVYLRQDMLKIEEVESGEVNIVRLDTQLLLKLNPANRTYTQTNFQALKLQSSQEEIAVRQQQPQVEMGQESVRRKMMDSMPVEQRNIVEEMMRLQMGRMRENVTTGGGAAGGVSAAQLRHTPDTKTMLGHQAKRVKVVQTIQGERKKIVEVWVTTQIEPLNYLSDFIGTLGLFRSGVVEELKKVEGFPLKMKYRIQTGPLKGNLQTVTATKLEQKILPISKFEVPSGYKPITAPDAAPMIEEEESF